MHTYRQGDVMLRSVESIPTDAEMVEAKGPVVLAYGTATGHSHAIANEFATEYKAGDKRFVDIRDGAELVHEEHATIKPEAGAYQIVQQREYTPEAIRNVAD